MVREAIPKDLLGVVCDAVGSKVKIEFARSVLFEVRPDKSEPRILALSQCRLYLISRLKSPVKIDVSVHFLDIFVLDSKNQNKLTVGLTDGRRLAVSVDEDCKDGKDIDCIVGHILHSIAGTFPAKPVDKLIATVDVKPPMRLKEVYEKMDDVKRHGETAPCGNFTAIYQCMCDYHGVDFMEDVAWDVDTIYLSHDSKELNLGDFDHLDARQMLSIISSLEHNTWFTGINASNIKLSTESVNELLKVLKSNTSIEQLNLHNTGLKYEAAQRLSLSLQANSASPLTTIDLSDNILEDKGVNHLCTAITKLSRGLIELNLSRTGLTTRGANRLAEALLSNRNIALTLKKLDLSQNSFKGEELTILCNFLAQPNALTHLYLASVEYPLENLFAALIRGCTQNLMHLDFSGNHYKRPMMREVLVPNSWKQFFSSSAALQSINFSNVRLPAEAVKSILLGIASNTTLKGVELNLSGNALGNSGGQVLEVCLPTVTNIASLDLSDNGFDASLACIMGKLSQNRSIRKLCIGRNLNNIKPKAIPSVMEAIIKLIQQDDSPIRCLIMDDLKLRADTTLLINALGLNGTLTELDISGNAMGDIGARMLSKALQINKKLTVIHWDHNGTSPNGFQDIASALEKNYTMKVMPTPVNDAAAALRINQTKTEQALIKIESLLQRNHSPRKFATDQDYRLQQGFLASSTQQMDELIVQIQDILSKLQKLAEIPADTQAAIDKATAVIKDANASRQLLSELQKVALQGDTDNPVLRFLRSFVSQLTTNVETHLTETVSNMVRCTETQCPLLLQNKDVRRSINDTGLQLVSLPTGFIESLVVEQLGTDITNKTGELNLSVATHLSDRVLDDITDLLEKTMQSMNQIMRQHLKSGSVNESDAKSSRTVLLRTPSVNSSATDEEKDSVPSLSHDMPTTVDKHKSLYNRRLRPQSTIDPTDITRALLLRHQKDEDRKSADGALGSSVDANPNTTLPSIASDRCGVIEENSDVDSSPVPRPRKRKGLSQVLGSESVQSPGVDLSAQQQDSGAIKVPSSAQVNRERPAPIVESTSAAEEAAVAQEQQPVPSTPESHPVCKDKYAAPLPPLPKDRALPLLPKHRDLSSERLGGKEPAEIIVNTGSSNDIRSAVEPQPAAAAAAAAAAPSPAPATPSTPVTPLTPTSKMQKNSSVESSRTTPSAAPRSAPLSTSDLPVLSSGAPKLNHYGASRPRRLKTKMTTRPTVGLPTAGERIDEAEEEGGLAVDAFYSTAQSSPINKSVDSPVVLNGEFDKGAKDKKSAKPPSFGKTDKSENSKGGGIASGLRNMFRRKGPDSVEATSPKTTTAPVPLEIHEEPRHEPTRHDSRQKMPEAEHDLKSATEKRDDRKENEPVEPTADTQQSVCSTSVKRGVAPTKALLPPGRAALPVVSTDVLAELRNKRFTALKPLAHDDDNTSSSSSSSEPRADAGSETNKIGRVGPIPSVKSRPPPPCAPKPARRPGSITETPAVQAAGDSAPSETERKEVTLDKNSNVTPAASDSGEKSPGDAASTNHDLKSSMPAESTSKIDVPDATSDAAAAADNDDDNVTALNHKQDTEVKTAAGQNDSESNENASKTGDVAYF